MAQTILYIILAVFIWEFVLTKVLAYLNNKNMSDTLPKEAKWIYDAKKYEKSQQYSRANYRFGLISSIPSFIVVLLLLMCGGFGWLDSYVRTMFESEMTITLVFFAILFVIQTLVSIPFSYYQTFVIEDKYGFNKMTKKIFWLDAVKSLLVSVFLGGLLITLIVWMYNWLWERFWLYAWGLLTFVSVFFMMFYSSLIVPIFNKQTPLEDGRLKKAIEKFAEKVWFKLDNIYVIDGSKRSTKANAYFSWFGPKKRIVLYDTLINDLATKELVAVLAHEIGHYKKKHTLQMLAFSVAQTGFMLYVLSLALGNPDFSLALGAEAPSFHMGIIAFGIVFAPISIILSLLGNIMSRKNEYEADAYAKEHNDSKALAKALKKLSVNNLSNLTPHPAYEFFYYSHPAVLKRLKALWEK